MRLAIFMVGVPGSGKSTVATAIQTYIATDSFEPLAYDPVHAQDVCPIVSLDAFRHLMCPTHRDTDGDTVMVSGKNRKQTLTAYLAAVEAHMQCGATIIFDNTHTVWRNIKDAYGLAKDYGYEVVFVRTQCPTDVAIARDARRRGSAHVGAETILRMAGQFESLRLPEDDRVIDVDTTDVRAPVSVAREICDFTWNHRFAYDVEDDFCVIVGDVHGMRGRLAQLEADLRGKSATVVFVGDLLDRGTDAAETVRVLDRIAEEHATHIVEGNHEEHMRHMLRAKGAYPRYRETKASYDELAQSDDGLIDVYERFLDGSELAFAFFTKKASYLVTHAGISKECALRMLKRTRMPLDMTASDFIYGCGERDALYRASHPSSYDERSILAADGKKHTFMLGRDLVQVHGHRTAGEAKLGNCHYDLESRVWMEDGCLTTLWVDMRTCEERVIEYH